jgi:hypothetical protein
MPADGIGLITAFKEFMDPMRGVHAAMPFVPE